MDKNYIRTYLRENVESIIKILGIAIEDSMIRAETDFPQYVSRLESNKQAIEKQLSMLKNLEDKFDSGDPHNLLQSIKLIENFCDFVHQDLGEVLDEMCGNDVEKRQIVH